MAGQYDHQLGHITLYNGPNWRVFYISSNIPLCQMTVDQHFGQHKTCSLVIYVFGLIPPPHISPIFLWNWKTWKYYKFIFQTCVGTLWYWEGRKGRSDVSLKGGGEEGSYIAFPLLKHACWSMTKVYTLSNLCLLCSGNWSYQWQLPVLGQSFVV